MWCRFEVTMSLFSTAAVTSTVVASEEGDLAPRAIGRELDSYYRQVA
jgi:hypothetical protein